MSYNPAEVITALNTAENAFGRAMTAVKKGNTAKAILETETGLSYGDKALDMLKPHDDHPPAPTADWVRADTVTPILSTFDINQWMYNAPDHPERTVEGAFRMTAVPSHISFDDPIVYPGQKGKAHLHMFYGNTKTDYTSTYQTLRFNPESSSDANMLNGSGYWTSAMKQGDMAVMPDYITMYYKRRPKNDPFFAANGLIPAEIPAGMRFVFGNNYKADPLPTDARPMGFIDYGLYRNGAYVLTGQPNMVEICKQAQVGDFIFQTLMAPNLWDGIHIDSPNHRAHLKYMYSSMQDPAPMKQDGFNYVIPTISQKLAYQVMPGDNPAIWRLSSDADGQPAGESGHADYFEAWDPRVRDMWQHNAIDLGLDCVAADFGNGKGGVRHPTFSFQYQPHLVPIPTV